MRKQKRSEHGTLDPKAEADSGRLLQELQIHQVELEMQNTELQEARNRIETLLEKYTDLYDFAPVGYFSLDEQGRILEANLTGAALLGLERSRLIRRSLLRLVAPASLSIFAAFLKRVFATTDKQVCEAMMQKSSGPPFWANFHGTSALARSSPSPWCRVTMSDITLLKQAEKTKGRVETLAAANRELQREVTRRQVVEAALKQSERDQRKLLEQSRSMQEQLRRLSHQALQAQEDERKRISRELHDEITQTLVSISVHLETLARQATVNPVGLKNKIARTRRLVEESVNIVHQFARELRPMALDDLGLIAALRSFMKDFMRRTGVRAHFSTFRGVELLSSTRRTALYRVVHSALTNVAQHAKADRVRVSIRSLGNVVLLEIKDNGTAFDVDRLLQVNRNRHLGLLGMRERVEMVGGQLTIESTPGQGTTIRAEIPFGNRRARSTPRRKAAPAKQ
jgi:PAS domain S-box-containing protein